MNANGRIALYLGGMVVGGIIGYLAIELIIDRVLYGAPEKKEGEDDIVTLDSQPSEKKFFNPSAKPNLADLVREYAPNPSDSIELPSARVITKDEALLFLSNSFVPLQTIRYYEGDGVYLIENDEEEDPKNWEILEEPEDLLPPNIHLQFLPQETELYCWNEYVAVVYLVKLYPQSYKTAVLGQPQKTATPAMRKRRKTPAKPAAQALAGDIDENDGKKVA